MYTEISYAFSIWFNSTTIVWYIATNGFHGLFSYNSHVMSYSKAKQQYIRSEHFSKWIYEYQKFVYACLGVIFANTSTQFVLSLIYNHDNNNNIYYYITNKSTVYACCEAYTYIFFEWLRCTEELLPHRNVTKSKTFTKDNLLIPMLPVLS